MTPTLSFRALQSVKDPQAVARWLLSLQLSREALLTAFATVTVLNALFFGISTLGGQVAGAAMPALFSPIVFVTMLAVSLIATIYAVTWAGRMVGGTATVSDIAVLVIWLQGLRVIIQGAMILLVPLSPGLASLTVIAASALGVWIFVNFIEVAHGLGNLMKAVIVLVFAVVGMGLVLSVIFSVIGITPEGLTSNV